MSTLNQINNAWHKQYMASSNRRSQRKGSSGFKHYEKTFATSEKLSRRCMGRAMRVAMRMIDFI